MIMKNPISERELVETYFNIKKQVINAGFGEEIDWQDNLCIKKVQETNLIKEFAWVILSSGMRETVIRNKFPFISKAFFNWDLKKITRNKSACKQKALQIFSNNKKIDAILFISEQIASSGYASFISKLQSNGVKYLETLPFMGPATSFHLAKNIGLDVVKPDRHLLRVTSKAGYCSPEKLCETISNFVGDKKSVIDVVIWRFAAITPNYLEYF